MKPSSTTVHGRQKPSKSLLLAIHSLTNQFKARNYCSTGHSSPAWSEKPQASQNHEGDLKKRLQSNRQILSRKTHTQRTQKQSSPNETAPKTNGEQAMSIAETTSKIHDPNTYDEAVSDPIQSPLERSHRRRITKPRKPPHLGVRRAPKWSKGNRLKVGL